MHEADRSAPQLARRQLLVGAAWSVPVVAVAVATPLAAASVTPDPDLTGVQISTTGHVQWTGFQWDVLIVPTISTVQYGGPEIAVGAVSFTVLPGQGTNLLSAETSGDTGRGWAGTGTGTFTNANVWPGDSTGFLANTIHVILNPNDPGTIGDPPVITVSPSGVALIGSGWSE